jgi:hypothetical protein
MQEAYKMVVVNLVGSIFVLFGSLFYRFIYPRKKINLFSLLLIIGILPIISVFRIGDYQSGDFNIHIYRMMTFFNSLKEGILMPSWAGDVNATYGNPLFLFNYTLPYYAICLLHFLGISFITATKLYLGLILYFSAIFMYFFAKEITNNKLAAFSSAIFYLFAPYHLIDVHFRATLGESTIFLIAPLIFLFLTKYSKTKKLIYLTLVSFLTYLLFLAHPLLAGSFVGIGILYVLFTEFINKNARIMFFQLTSLFIGVIMSAYIWAPFIIYYPYMFHYPTSSYVGFYPFSLLFYSPWRFGLLFQGPEGELATIIGYTQIFVLLASLILLIKNKFSKKTGKQILFWTMLFLATLFAMNPLSNIFWRYIPSIGAMFTLYSRLSLALAFFISIIAGYFILRFEKRKKLIYLLLILTIGSTILNWGQRTMLPEINDATLSKNVSYSTLTEGPINFLDTKWADPKNPWFSKIPQNHLDILKGVGYVKQLQRTTTKHVYLISASTPLTIQENTLYFPGWHVTSNGGLIPVHPGYRGIITFNLSKGNQNVIVEYNDIFSVFALKIVSGIVILLIMIYCLNFLKNLLQKA